MVAVGRLFARPTPTDYEQKIAVPLLCTHLVIDNAQLYLTGGNAVDNIAALGG